MIRLKKREAFSLLGFYLPFNKKLVEVDGIVLKNGSKESVFSSYYWAISFWMTRGIGFASNVIISVFNACRFIPTPSGNPLIYYGIYVYCCGIKRSNNNQFVHSVGIKCEGNPSIRICPRK